jgi:AbrB family looped-hinge helix DNA binding protein
MKGAHMAKLATTKMSSKGQVVIPEEIRARLGLKAGIQFVVIGERDVVILKALTAPSMADFDDLINKARKEARKSGLKRSDIRRTTSKVRGRG